ncbi:hypothetical protein KFK09_003429 [Dendrobium nobile]|uniref:Histone deacetylase interacting domain-containing protein n=1 Tax=Dendrobium nobile TaxID=94219 RepID=A0A8T3C2J5_DENNO|nr:hypothetical protein KFK09_003429 [Dendrobium nobile]
MASDMDTSEQKLTTSDALAYLKCVKYLFKDNKEKYNEFLQVMRDFKSQRINTYEVIMKVQELFKGHSDLILGFSKFLPNGYEIKVPEEKKPAEFHEAFTFVSKIKSRFENDQLTYRSFLDTLEMYRNHTKSSSEVRREVALLFKNHEDLFMEFLHFLPDTSTSTAQLVSHGRRFARRDKFRTMKPSCMQKIQDRDMDREHEKKDANMTVESVKHRENKQINQGSPYVSKDVANHKVSFSPSIMDYKDLDLSNCPSCTPSYRLLPENCRAPVSSDRTELDKSVLNDIWVSVTSRTEDYSSNPSKKSQYEESLFKCEDDRYELDMLVELANTTIEKVQNLVKKMQDDNDINKLESPFRIEDHLTSRNLNCIERVYGDNGFDVVDALKKNASVALPLILDRLKQKQEEWTSYRANFNKLFFLRSKKSIRRKNEERILSHGNWSGKCGGGEEKGMGLSRFRVAVRYLARFESSLLGTQVALLYWNLGCSVLELPKEVLLALGVIFVHDLSQRRTKASLQNWAAEIASTGTFLVPLGSGGPGDLPVPYLIIANKTDISSNQRHASSGNLVDVARMWVEKQGLLPSSEELPLIDRFPGSSSLLAAAKEARYDKEAVMKFFKQLIRRRYFPDEQPAPSPWPVPPVPNSEHLDNQFYSSFRVDKPVLHSQRTYAHSYSFQRFSETRSDESDSSKLEIAEINY